jgi:hypothetical protein
VLAGACESGLRPWKLGVRVESREAWVDGLAELLPQLQYDGPRVKADRLDAHSEHGLERPGDGGVVLL